MTQIFITSVRRVLVHNYHADEECPYQGVLHDPETDTPLDKHKVLSDLMSAAGVADGDEIDILVCRTGRRPHEDQEWRLVAPHEYRPCPVKAKKEGA